MNNNIWTKTTNYKIFGKTVLTKEEICSDCEYQGEVYKIQVTQDYFNQEFGVDEKKKEQ